MGIQSVLTLAVALVILGAAFALRGLVLGLSRLVFAGYRSGRRQVSRHRAPRLEQALPRITLRERAAGVGRALTALAQYVAALVAPVWNGLVGWLRVEAENAYSGKRGRATYQAIGESPTTWAGRPHAVLTRR